MESTGKDNAGNMKADAPANSESRDPSSTGETIDDIVNELRSSGVQLSMDDSPKPVADVEDDSQQDVEEIDRSCDSPHEEASVATTVSLHSPVSSENGEMMKTDDGSDEIVVLDAESDDAAPVKDEEEQQSHSEPMEVMEDGDGTSKDSTSEVSATVEPQKVNGEVDISTDPQGAEEGIQEDHKAQVDDKDSLKAKTSKEEAASIEENNEDDEELDRPLSSLKRKVVSKPTKKQVKQRRPSLLKVSMSGMLHKKTPKRNSTSAGSKKQSELKRPLGKTQDKGDEKDSQNHVVKRSKKQTEDSAGPSSDEVTGDSKPEQPEPEKKEHKPVSKKTARRDVKEAVPASAVSEESETSEVRSLEEPEKKEHRSVAKKTARRDAREAVPTSARSEESETSEAWSLEEFVASDRYLKDVIGRSLGSTNGRFLTIELPEVDTVKRQRVWRTPPARRSRPVVYGGCDPSKVYVTVMGVRVPISCWSKIDTITPNVLLTDIFKDLVRWQSDAGK